MLKADVVFRNGHVITVNRATPKAQALAVYKNLIVGVGSNDDVEPFISAQTRVTDLGGRTLIPGLNDAHCHTLASGLSLMSLDLRPPTGGTIEKIKKLLSDKIRDKPPGTWIEAFNYRENLEQDKRFLTRWDLDEVSPDHPVFIHRYCMHVGICNSRALRTAGIEGRKRDSGSDGIELDGSSGEPTGMLSERAQDLIKDYLPAYETKDLVEAIRMANESYASLGITSIHDGSSYASFSAENEFEAWHQAYTKGFLKARTYLMMGPHTFRQYRLLGGRSGFGDSFLKLGPVKLFADGGFGGANAALREPYCHLPHSRGALQIPLDELKELINDLHANHYQVAIHAMGDYAIESILDAFAAAMKHAPRQNHRHLIQHCALCPPDLIEKMIALQIIPVMQTQFLYIAGDSHKIKLGHARSEWEFPVKSFLNAGVEVPLSSDRPVTDGNPLYGFYSAVTRKTSSGQTVAPAQAINREEALRAYTLSGAYASFEEYQKGTLEVGKLADVVMLTANPCEVDAEQLLNLKVQMTMIDGKVVYGDLD